MLSPDEAKQAVQEQGEKCRTLAEVCWNLSDFAGAAKHLTSLLRLDVYDAAARLKLFQCHRRMGEHERSRVDADEMLVVDPESSQGLLCLGQALEELKEPERALLTYRRGIASATSAHDAAAVATLQEHENRIATRLEAARAAPATPSQESPPERRSPNPLTPPGAAGSFDLTSSPLPSLNTQLSLTEASPSSSPQLSIESATPDLDDSKTSNPDKDKFDLMEQWLRQGSAKFPKLYMEYYGPEYRGVHCTSRIAVEEQILFVPHRHIMTSEVARASAIGARIIDTGIQLRSKHSLIAAFLLQERAAGAASFWYPYIVNLPSNFDSMPLFFDEHMLQELQGSFCLSKISEQLDSFRREYDDIRRVVHEFNQYTLEDFVWARLVVITRIFGLRIGDLATEGLVPYADMLNHKWPKESRWNYDDRLRGFVITATQPISGGNQVFDSYGRKCNSRFFVNYGFALPDNSQDNEAVLKYDFAPESTLDWDFKRSHLGHRPLCHQRVYQVPADYVDEKAKTKDMFSFLRFMHASSDQLPTWRLTLTDVAPISAANEIAVLRSIRRAAQQSLAAFATTIAEDNRLLQESDKLSFAMRNCVIMRRGEKQVLQWYIDVADAGIFLLSMSLHELERTVRSFFGYSGHYSSGFECYVQSVIITLVRRAPLAQPTTAMLLKTSSMVDVVDLDTPPPMLVVPRAILKHARTAFAAQIYLAQPNSAAAAAAAAAGKSSGDISSAEVSASSQSSQSLLSAARLASGERERGDRPFSLHSHSFRSFGESETDSDAGSSGDGSVLLRG